MSHPIYRVVSVDVVAPYTVQLRFDDGLERRIDFSGILSGALFGPLRDDALFKQVRVDPEVHTIVWPNGADFAPRRCTTGLCTKWPFASSPSGGNSPLVRSDVRRRTRAVSPKLHEKNRRRTRYGADQP